MGLKISISRIHLFISIVILSCNNEYTFNASMDKTSQYKIDTSNLNTTTSKNRIIDVKHKYSYVNENEDGSIVVGLLELYGTNDFVQSSTMNGMTLSGRGKFEIEGNTIKLNRKSGIAIDGKLTISKVGENKIWLTLENGVTYVQDDYSQYLKNMEVTPGTPKRIRKITELESLNAEILIYRGKIRDTINGFLQEFTLNIKTDFSSASIGSNEGEFHEILKKNDEEYIWTQGTIIGMHFRLTGEKAIIYNTDGTYFGTLNKLK